MVIIGLLMLVCGFFFPPAWLGLVGYGIYLYASRKSRRDDAIESRVRRMVGAGVATADFPDLYYDAARAYAVAKGATAADDDSAAATVVVDSRSYFVVFIKQSTGGGTSMSVSDSRQLERQLTSHVSPRP
ncbi:hypothetical protein ACLF3G_20110 [Falsiroseomonas sp. HC035]|uniref:hypothetical protein n=1 Tax=Falsiroseomonas sp. HC035 TaxID=3390999 RepID=UPI003D323B59